jgi:hypothetical protein
LVAIGGLGPEGVKVVGEVVLDAVAGDRAGGVLPGLRFPGGRRVLAERLAQPPWTCGDFAIGELVAQLSVFSLELLDGAVKALAFLPYAVRFADLPGQSRSVAEGMLNLLFSAGERGGQARAFQQARVGVAPEQPPVRLGELVKLAAEAVALLGERTRPAVGSFDLCQFAGRQRGELAAQALKPLAERREGLWRGEGLLLRARSAACSWRGSVGWAVASWRPSAERALTGSWSTPTPTPRHARCLFRRR